MGNDLEEIDLAQLPYNHPLCSGILDTKSKPISDMPEFLHNVFEQNTNKRYSIPRTEESLPAIYDPPFGEWIERPEKLEMLTKQILEALYVI